MNAASYKPAVAPGSIAAVFGTFLVNSTTSTSSTPWPTALGGLSVTFNGTQDATGDPGWLDLVSPSQVNLQVPWELAGRSNIVAMASLNGHLGGPQTVNLAPVAPESLPSTRRVPDRAPSWIAPIAWWMLPTQRLPARPMS